MDLSNILKTLFELALVIFTLWALFHEDRFAAIEQRIFANIRRRKLRVVKAQYKQNLPIRER